MEYMISSLQVNCYQISLSQAQFILSACQYLVLFTVSPWVNLGGQAKRAAILGHGLDFFWVKQAEAAVKASETLCGGAQECRRHSR